MGRSKPWTAGRIAASNAVAVLIVARSMCDDLVDVAGGIWGGIVAKVFPMRREKWEVQNCNSMSLQGPEFSKRLPSVAEVAMQGGRYAANRCRVVRIAQLLGPALLLVFDVQHQRLARLDDNAV